MEALGRSRELTRGARWKVFGLFLVVFVLYWLALGAIGVSSRPLFGMPDFALLAAEGTSPGYLAFTAVVETVTAAVWSVIQSSLYIELRDWKDGPPTDRLAEIFA